MKIKMQSLSREYEQHRDRYLEIFDDVCSKAAFCDGEFVHRFEREYAEYCGVKRVSAVNSGSDALILGLRALGVGKGDEVILPSLTFVSTAWSVLHNGAIPVFADCDKDTWEISVPDVEKLINKKTKAVIGVHLYGNMFDAFKLKELTDSFSLPLVEDSAQAHGAVFNGKKAGSIGKIGCFSFYPTKNLGAFGEGGCVTSDDENITDYISALKKHMQTSDGDHLEAAYNMRMHGLQAAVLSEKLKRLDEYNLRRAKTASRYLEAISGSSRLTPQKITQGSTGVYHVFNLKAEDRDGFINYMNGLGIETGIQYRIPCHLQTAFKEFGYKKGSLPNTEEFTDKCVAIPISHYLTEKEVEYICQALHNYK